MPMSKPISISIYIYAYIKDRCVSDQLICIYTTSYTVVYPAIRCDTTPYGRVNYGVTILSPTNPNL